MQFFILMDNMMGTVDSREINLDRQAGRSMDLGAKRRAGIETTDQDFRCHFNCVGAKLLQSCLTLCDPMDCSLPGSSVHEILQARTLEWVAMLFSRGSSRPRDGTRVSYVSYIGRQVLYYQRHLRSKQMCPRRPSIPNLLFQQLSFLKCHHPSPSRKLSIYVQLFFTRSYSSKVSMEFLMQFQSL